MAEQYFEWVQPMSADPNARSWSIEFPEWVWVKMTMSDGKPVEDWDSSLIARYAPYGEPLDFRLTVGGSWHIHSGRLKRLIERAAPAVVQYLPFRLRASVGSSDIQDYCIANHLRLIDCLDRERTTLRTATWEPINPLGNYAVHRPVLSRKLIGAEILFRVKGNSRRVIVHNDLKQRIEQSGMTGSLFNPIKVDEQ